MIDAGFHDVLGQVKRLIQESPFPSIRLLEVEVEGKQFLLRGSVESFYLKQIAQETVRSVVRSAELLNDIHVNA
jgi:osmotically-inducible protein OsmY